MARTISSSTIGPIALGASDNPLSITGTGQVTSTGTVDGIDGAAGTVWTIANSGTIGAATGFGIYLAGAGFVSSGGVITGKDGVIIRGGGGVTNTGLIKAVGAIGGGPWVGSGVFLTGAAGTVSNGGTINGQAYGVAVDAGGLVTNTGSIIGGEDGVRIYGLGTMINSGTVIATADDGVGLHSGGSVANLAGASIILQGTGGAGIYTGNGIGTVTNSGAVSGIDYGVDIAGGGSLTNNAGASISGHRGVNIQGGVGTVNNGGIIGGPNDFGVGLSTGGQVINASGGSISGFWGVAVYNVGATVTNNGTISGTNHAVRFSSSGSNRLILGATGVLIGDVVGSTASGSSNTLELAGGTGTLSGLSGGAGSITENGHSSGFSSFNTLAFDTGASWTLTGRNTIATLANSGSVTIASNGSLTVTGAVDPASSGLFSLAGNAVLDFAVDVGPGVQVAFQGPTGVLELADIAGGVVRRFGGSIAGLNVGTSTTVPTNAINIQTTVTGAVLSGNTITVSNGATTVASLVLSAAPAAGTSIVTRADPTLGGYDVFLTNSGNPLPTVTWTPGTETGVEGGAIVLGTITPTGTGLTSVLVSGIPIDATLGDGTHSFVASAGATAVNVLGWNYARLSIAPPNDANFLLSTQATDAAGNVSAVASEVVTVSPLAPTVLPLGVSGLVGQAIVLNLGIGANRLTGDSNSLASVTIGGIPSGATLSNTNGDVLTVAGGGIAFSGSQIAAGVLNGLAITPSSAGSFSLSVAATEQDAQGNRSSTASGTEAVSAGGPPTVTWSPATETGVEGTAIALGTISPAGTGLASVQVSGIPVGATLSDGTHSFIASAVSTSVDVLAWNDAALSIKPANDINFALSVQATDGSGNMSAAASEAVTVNPLAPTVAPLAASGSVGQAIALSLGLAANGLAGDSNSLSTVTIGSIPAGATLSNTNGDVLTVAGGGITFSASQIAAGVLNGLAITPSSAGSFSLSVSATEQDTQGNPSTATGTEALNVGGPPTVTWSPATETGVEGSGIALGAISPAGTGLASVQVSGIPVGATLSDGTHSFVASVGATSVNVLGWNDAALSVKPVSGANFSLSVQVTDGSGNVSVAASETVTVNPLAPTVAPGAISGTVGHAIALNLGITANSLVGDSNSLSSVTIGSIPGGATLSNTNNDSLIVAGGSIVFSAAQIAAGVLNGLAITPAGSGSFALSVAAAERDAQGDPSATSTGTEMLTVTGTVGAGGTISTSVSGPITLTAANNPLTVTSTGKITTTGSGDGVSGASGTSWTVSNSGTISASTGSASGIRLRGPGTVTNSGLITTSGSAYGVGLDRGGTVTNTSTIIGGEDGVRITTGIGTLINSGSIASKIDDGIGFFAGGLVANAASGSISNLGTKGAGIYITGGLGTVTNSGAITGIDYAVDLAQGGSVSNDAGASITSHRGVNVQGGTGTVNNSGSIGGTTSFGVRLSAGGQVTNATGGSISGPLGVAVYSAAATVTNSGTISGTSHAVKFAGSGANRLVVGATGVLIGDVVGSSAAGSSNTLELAGGTGTLSGLSGGAGSITENGHSSAFSSFNTIAVDTGAAWTLTGKDSVANLLDNGSVTIANGGSLGITSAVDPASAGVFLLTGSSSLEVAAALGTNTQMSFLGSGRLTVDKFGSFGTNVGSTAYAGPQLMSFTADDAIDILQFSAAGDALSYNALTGVLQISNSASQLASLSFQNANLGSGAFHAASDGGSGILITHN